MSTTTTRISRRALITSGTVAAGAGMAAGLGRIPPAAAATAYTNPVIGSNLPDPGVLRAGNTYYLYATEDGTDLMPVRASSNLVDWEVLDDGQPELAPWEDPGQHWAPEVIEIDGKFHAYYTAHDRESETQAIGRAVSDHPAGPFVDTSEKPFLATPKLGGCIDASPFRDDDRQLWLLWKNDGNAKDLPSYLYTQRLTDDGTQLTGERTLIAGQDEQEHPWEIYTIEGPAVISHEGRYYLFYSAGEFFSDTYAVGVAVAEAVDGPWLKDSTNPILSSNEVAAGPGHGVPVTTDNGIWYVYHAWDPEHIGEDPGRQIWVSPVTIDGTAVTIDGPMEENPASPVG